MHSFDNIYLLDLHGSSKKKERCPDGSKDENVFDIQQGVAVGIFARLPTRRKTTSIRHADLWGLREVREPMPDGQPRLTGGKYYWLYKNSAPSTKWSCLRPKSPFYLFAPQDIELLSEYERGWKITEAIPLYGVGMTTARDHVVIDFERDPILERAKLFRDSTDSDAELCRQLAIPMKKGWNIPRARALIRKEKDLATFIKPIMYRPFDHRLIFYHDSLVWRTVKRVMVHVLPGDNVGILLPRQIAGTFRHVFCTKLITNFNALDTAGRFGSGSLFPLYVHPDADARDLFGREVPSRADNSRRPNLNPDFIAELEKRLGWRFIPDGKGNLGILSEAQSGTGVSPVNPDEQDAHATPEQHPDSTTGRGTGVCGTGVPPVNNHGQDAHATNTPSSPETKLHIRHGAYLPHWTYEGAEYFVTFRLADSLPQSVVEAWRAERDTLLRQTQAQKGPLPPPDATRLMKLFSEKVEAYLDAGTGSCLMRRDDVAAIVRDALLHFHDKRYTLLAWCIMPNHVHIVLRPKSGHGLPDILHSWKSLTAKNINRLLIRKGRVWQPEYYDHLIRDEADLNRCINYTLSHPEKAGMPDWKWRGPGTDQGGTGVSPVNNHGQDAHATGTFGPEDIFGYMYAVFHSPTYRTRYAEFLKIDFPRLPLTSSRPLFRALSKLGGELVPLHLMDKHAPIRTKYPEEGDNRVEKVRYTEPGQGAPTGRVWINNGQYFENVPPEIWQFHIGGYQVCQKWLKDRKGRVLTYDDLTHYQHIVSALGQTIPLMAEIDQIINDHGGWPIQ